MKVSARWRGLASTIILVSVLKPPGAFADVSVKPDPTGLPGSDKLQRLTDGLYSWVLIAALVGLLVSGAAWALGSHSNHYGASTWGRKGVLVAAFAALIIGAGPTIINFFYALGRG